MRSRIVRWVILLWGLSGLAACALQSTPVDGAAVMAQRYPDQGPAPELENEVWLNVDAPLRLADLRGKVVALDMWTFD